MKIIARVFLLLTLSGCALLGPNDLIVLLEPERAYASAGDPLMIDLTVRNPNNSRVSWGRGSSSCQLGLFVRIEGRDVPAAQVRACTLDLATHQLGPGESRTERIEWSGLIVVGDSAQQLDPGHYQLRAAAGREFWSELHPVIVTGK